MAANLRYVKEIKKKLSDVLQLLNEFVFGGKDIRLFKETETYTQGDFVIKQNVVTGNYELFQCMVPITSGVFNESDWSKNSVSDFTAGNKINTDIVQLSQQQPTSPINLLWYQIKSVKSSIDENKISTENIVFISSEDQVVAQDDEPSNPNSILWFDFTV